MRLHAWRGVAAVCFSGLNRHIDIPEAHLHGAYHVMTLWMQVESQMTLRETKRRP